MTRMLVAIIATILLSVSAERCSGVGEQPIIRQSTLHAADAGFGGRFGFSVSLASNRALVGAIGDDAAPISGSAYIFQDNGSGDWSQVAKLKADDGTIRNRFGASVSLSGNLALVGASRENAVALDAGAAYVFRDDGSGNWTQASKLIAENPATDDEFGWSVSLSGDVALVGALAQDGSARNSGAAYLFRDEGTGGWSRFAKLTASDEGRNQFFGWSVSISGNTALVGAPGDGQFGTESGAAYVFRDYGNGDWTQIAKLTANDAAGRDWFGRSVSLAGDTALIGAYLDDDSGQDSGSAYVFQDDGTGQWRQIAKLKASDGEEFDLFGESVSVSGTTAVVGAIFEDRSANNDESGSAYVFRDDGTGNWLQVAKLTDSEFPTGAKFGKSVSLCGGSVLIGAHDDHEFGSGAGAAYVFLIPEPSCVNLCSLAALVFMSCRISSRSPRKYVNSIMN